MYRTLIDAPTLAAHLDDPAYVVVDCRHALADHALGRRLYEHSHIAGALFADVERDLSGTKTGGNGRHPLPDPQAFAAYLRGIGVSAQTQLVAYDAGGDMFASRLWFLARWIGHEACAVLDGGFSAWSAGGYPVESGEARPRAAGTIEPQVRDDLVVPASYVLEHLHDGSMTLIDARASDRFGGRNETVDPVAGHIPGARNHFFKENFEADGRFKSPEALRAALAPYGSSAQIVHQCGSGVSGAVNLLAMEIAGASGSRLYAGSWSEWIADPSRPVVTGNA